MDEAITPLGALTEAARRQQQQAQSTIDRLTALAQGLDQIVRQEIRSALVEEFQALGTTGRHVSEALDAVRRAAGVRIALCTLGLACASAAIPITVARMVLPSHAELVKMRAERDQLAEGITLLEQRGGHVDLRRCGAASRLCVRVERAAPAYGAQGDYLVVKGY